MTFIDILQWLSPCLVPKWKTAALVGIFFISDWTGGGEGVEGQVKEITLYI